MNDLPIHQIISSFLLLVCALSLQSQVVVRCPDNNFNNLKRFRCVPTEESALDSIHITPCDCDDQRNTFIIRNLCYRQISLCTDSLVIPQEIEAFDFPYFDIEPSSISNLLTQDGRAILNEWDPESTLDPFSENPDAALLVEIDTTSKCAILEAWTPMGQAGGMRVSHDLGDNTEGVTTLVILPDDDDCDRFRERCFRVASTHDPLPISDNGLSTQSWLETLFPGRISSISILNVHVTHDNIQELSARLIESLNGESVDVFSLICPFYTSINFGFSDDATSVVDCTSDNPTDIFLPQESFSKIYFTDLGDPDFASLTLAISDDFSNGVTNGMLHSWELEVCIQELSCGPFVTSTDIPKSIGPDANTTTTSEIVITESGNITDLNIRNLDITHSWIGDLSISLTSPSGTEVVLYNRECGGSTQRFGDIHTSLDDENTQTLSCPPIDPLFSISPTEALSAFDGEEAEGTWILTITDNASQDGGTLNDWTLEICTRCPAEYTLVNNNEIRGTALSKIVYDTDGPIQSRELINTDGDTIRYSAGSSTNLLREFTVDTGSVFEVLQEGCLEE